LQPAVAADLSAECHASTDNLRIRRLKPPLQEVEKAKYGMGGILYYITVPKNKI
jgi:hypothetical protein